MPSLICLNFSSVNLPSSLETCAAVSCFVASSFDISVTGFSFSPDSSFAFSSPQSIVHSAPSLDNCLEW